MGGCTVCNALQGDISPQSDPALYLRNIAAMHHWYLNQGWAQAAAGGGHVSGACAPWPPLVVNTHGWVTGFGLDLLTEVLRLLQPTYGK
jgi:polynucleotide 5'-hydroxyl-kinase GRC3/NOL9